MTRWLRGLEVVPLEPHHIVDAAVLVARDARKQRLDVPELPCTLDDPAVAASQLESIVGNGLGVAVLDAGELVGFLAGAPVSLWGAPGVYVAEWGNAARDRRVVLAAYAAASRLWVTSGRGVHAVTLWVRAGANEAAWHQLGFGRVVVDAVRGLGELAAGGGEVRRATVADVATIASFEGALWHHLAAPPVCRVHPPPVGPTDLAERLADPRRPLWLIEDGGQAIGYVSLTSEHETTALAADDTVVCDGAFVVPEARRRGAGRTLVSAAIAWAAADGFARLAIDYESANIEATEFWPAVGFCAVLHSVARTVAVPKAP